MNIILMTGAQDASALEKELREFRELTHQSPAFIVGHHELSYALAAHPKSFDRSGDAFFDDVRLLCLHELWDIEARSFGCRRTK